MFAFGRLTVAAAILTVSWSLFAETSAPTDRPERAVTIPALLAAPVSAVGRGVAVPQGRTTPSPRARTDSVVVVFSGDPGIARHDSMAVLVSNRAALAALWKRLWDVQPPPKVDFRKGSVLVVGAGSMPTTDYGLVIRNVQARSTEIAVYADLNTPGFGCLTGQAVTYPLVIVQFVRRRAKMPQLPVRLYMTKVRGPRCES